MTYFLTLKDSLLQYTPHFYIDLKVALSTQCLVEMTGKHDTLKQFWCDVGDARPALHKHCFNVSCLLRSSIPANTKRHISAGLMLSQRRRRWANNNPTLGQVSCLLGSRISARLGVLSS